MLLCISKQIIYCLIPKVMKVIQLIHEQALYQFQYFFPSEEPRRVKCRARMLVIGPGGILIFRPVYIVRDVVSCMLVRNYLCAEMCVLQCVCGTMCVWCNVCVVQCVCGAMCVCCNMCVLQCVCGAMCVW